LVNTGWSGGPYGVGTRIKLAHTRAIIDAIHSGALADAPAVRESVFGLSVPTRCPEVPESILLPERSWSDKVAYQAAAQKLAGLFRENFEKYADQASEEVRAEGPHI
jgi:phosphoenolpyruvate carboxykinase (ATP)